MRIRLAKLCLLLLSPIIFGGYAAMGQTIPSIAENQCLSLFKPLYCNKPATNFTNLDALSDATDLTWWEAFGPLEVALQVDAGSTASDSLILHWRTRSWQNRDSAEASLRTFQILVSTNSTDGSDGDWTLLGTYQNHSKDNFVLFPNTHPKWVKVKELTSNHLALSRLEVFQTAPPGMKDDIWLFFGDSKTNNCMGVGNTHSQAPTYFGDQIHADLPCFYPIIINGGKGGEKAVEAVLKIDSILDAKPRIAVVAYSYGVNDLIIDDLVPYGDPNKAQAVANFLQAFQSIGEKCIQRGILPIPARIPFVFFPNSYSWYVDPTPDQSFGVRPFDENDIDSIISQMAPYAMDMATNIPLADFYTWFHAHRNDPEVFLADGVHFDKVGIDMFNKIWVEVAETVVYSRQQASCVPHISVTCPASFTVEVQDTAAQIPVSWPAPDVVTNCPVSPDVTVNQTQGDSSGALYGLGVYVVSYQVIDSCGSVDSCAFSFTVGVVNDSFDCASLPGFIKLGEFATHGYFLSQDAFTWSDARLQSLKLPGHMVSIGTTAENDFLQSAIQTAGVDLAFTGFNDEMAESNPEWANYEPVSIDKSMTNTPSNDYGLLTAWDGNWLMTNASIAKPYILEATCFSPTGILSLLCPGQDLSITLMPGQPDSVIQWTTPQVVTTCTTGGAHLMQIAGPADSSALSPGQYVVRYAATDACGNADTCMFQIQVNPSPIDPAITLTCPGVLSVDIPPGQSTAAPVWQPPTASTNCYAGGIAVTQTAGIAPGTHVPEGDYVISYLATDHCNVQQTCSFTIHVNPPPPTAVSVSCGQDLYIQLNPGQQDTLLQVQVMAQTSCPVGQATVQQTGGPDLTVPLAPGSYDLQFAAQDACNNTDTCSMHIDIVPYTSLTLECAPAMDIILPPLTTDTVVNLSLPTAGTTCPETGIAVVQVSGPVLPALLGAGNYTIAYQASDSCGHTAYCTTGIHILTAAPADCHTDSIPGFILIGILDGHRYYRSATPYTWFTALALARAHGWDLASIGDPDENAFLAQRIGDVPVWIGLTDREQESVLTWSDGAPLDFENTIWNNTGTQDFGLLNPWTGYWSMAADTVRYPLLMEQNCVTVPYGTSISIYSIYPNPTSELVRIHLVASHVMDVAFKLIDAHGVLVWSDSMPAFEGEKIYHLNMETIARGIYFLHISGPNFRRWLKLMKI